MNSHNTVDIDDELVAVGEPRIVQKESETRMKKSALIALAMAIVLFAAGAFLALGAVKAFHLPALFGTESETHNTQVITAVTRTEQVALLSLGIQGILKKTENRTFLGMDVPGSERASLMMYKFNAKLGIEGKDVKVSQTGDNQFLVSVPRFIFIGHDKERFELFAENNGIMSWVTPEIDPVEMINNVLNDNTEAQYVASNKAVLEDQAKSFYSGIISSIDPAITVTFEFRRGQ